MLLPAALGWVEIDGPADVLTGYLPDLERDVRAPLLAAGHGARGTGRSRVWGGAGGVRAWAHGDRERAGESAA